MQMEAAVGTPESRAGQGRWAGHGKKTDAGCSKATEGNKFD